MRVLPHVFTIMVFDKNYWVFDLGLSLNRYLETDNQDKWIRKEFCIGLLIISLRFSWIFKMERVV